MVLPRGRRLFALVLAALACAGAGSLLVYGPKRAARVARGLQKAAKGKLEATDLPALGRNGSGLGIVERILEAKLESSDPETRRAALLGLVRGFPENRHARAVRAYEALTGESYFEGGWAKVTGSTHVRGASKEIALAEAIARWKDLIAENPDFPGRDDAGLRLARCQEEAGDARAAFATLLAARSWGDRDAGFVIEDRIANVLDAQLSLEETLDLARGSANALVVYSAAVKLARVHRFEEAARELDRFEALAARGEVDLLGHSPSYFVWREDGGREVVKAGEFRSDVRAQRALWLELAAASPLDRAERLLRAPHAFENLVLHESVRTDRAGVSADEKGADERFAAYTRARNHLAQAARLFDAVAKGEPALRARALLGAALARIGLAGYWGRAHGHAVSAANGHELADEAHRATFAALAACATPTEHATAAAAICAALAEQTRHGPFDSSRVLEEGVVYEVTNCRAEARDDQNTAFAYREESPRGR